MSHYCEDCHGVTDISGSPCYDGCEDCPCESESERELVSDGVACNHRNPAPPGMPLCHCEQCDCDCHDYSGPDDDPDPPEDQFDWDSYVGPV